MKRGGSARCDPLPNGTSWPRLPRRRGSLAIGWPEAHAGRCGAGEADTGKRATESGALGVATGGGSGNEGTCVTASATSGADALADEPQEITRNCRGYLRKIGSKDLVYPRF